MLTASAYAMGLPEMHAALTGDFGGSKQVQMLKRCQAGQVLQAEVSDAGVVSVQAREAGESTEVFESTVCDACRHKNPLSAQSSKA